MSYHAIAIDGPAGAGKSTIAKLLAKKLNYTYIDTGAMYRATTYKALNLGVDLIDPESFSFLNITDFVFKNGELYMDGTNMTKLNRSKEVADNVSLVASHIPVRNKLVSLQQEIAENNHVVMDGRDIGTVVLTHAQLKVFLTASVKVRAKRRYEELKNAGRIITLEDIEKDIERRDKYDSTRSYNPLRKAQDAIEIDTSDKDIREVVDLLYKKYIKIVNEGEL
ncbi:MAG: (d)CMP kinase [Candidatus Izemoplasmatales bacterium]|uniref:Cytidylate kinase n=1 Tax=Hujiaoplasma nucleasis TaxID=2725268 RepID=A0A7L6N0I7_9MOLU|nr:(d)CMP kinase [Hujiaoplasma nucleasis]QLY39753.1 (d)CMP kinase [Hujiaoplasma nucleasis]